MLLLWVACSNHLNDTAPMQMLASQYDITAFGPPACGGPRQEGMFVGVGNSLFNNGANCGKTLSIRHEEGMAIWVTINNLCPECDDKNTIDLQSQGAWPALKATIHDQYSEYNGDIPVTVRFQD